MVFVKHHANKIPRLHHKNIDKQNYKGKFHLYLLDYVQMSKIYILLLLIYSEQFGYNHRPNYNWLFIFI